MITSTGDRIFSAVNYFLLMFIFVIVLYPMIYIIAVSVSDPILVARGEIRLFPQGFNLDAYRNVFKNSDIWIGYRNTFFYTICGTAVNLFVTITCAFALARKKLAGKGWIMGFFVITMFFSGGIIPSYILIKNLGMLDTRWVMILPGAISIYHMIVTRTFFQSTIPEEMYEAAKIDGASDIGILCRIALPLSLPIIAVMGLFYGVSHWNQFFGALIYLNDRDLFPLQLVLRNILLMNQQLQMDVSMMTSEEFDYVAKQAYMAESMKYALIFIASFPMLVAYPFVQRFFVQGVMIGSLKG
ncbi:carbohydrate ABC transporter permease [Paenibacillus sp. GCM10027626]|uniref:carbohydrate ABC transporter permease n=1 Tax=Paenibacillus sp. GCM10027626 TaxID=3273411 RepID=UPI00362B95B3